MVTSFGNVCFSHQFTSRTGLSSSSSWQRIALNGPVVAAWSLSTRTGVASWAGGAADPAVNKLEWAFGGIALQPGSARCPPRENTDVDYMAELGPKAVIPWTTFVLRSPVWVVFSNHHLGCSMIILGSTARISMAMMKVVLGGSFQFQASLQTVQQAKYWWRSSLRCKLALGNM